MALRSSVKIKRERRLIRGVELSEFTAEKLAMAVAPLGLPEAWQRKMVVMAPLGFVSTALDIYTYIYAICSFTIFLHFVIVAVAISLRLPLSLS